jgi:lipoprotein-anchoring transpeptidase ErfK/SrfK
MRVARGTKVAIGVGAVALMRAAGAWLGVAYAGTPRIGSVTPGPGGWARQHTPKIAIHVDNAGALRSYTVTVDGKPVTADTTRSGDALVVSGVPIADGRHTVVVRASAGGLFGGTLVKRWTFSVDTSPPTLTLASRLHGYQRQDTLALSGTSEPGAKVTAAAGKATTTVTAGADGSFQLALDVADGSYPLTLSARDAAGNSVSHTSELHVDSNPPTLTVDADARPATDRPKLTATATDTSPVHVTATLDGSRYVLGKRPSEALVQGVHTLKVTATDAAGNTTTHSTRMLVDTSEKLGQARLGAGARGHDVTQIQHLLVRQGLLKKNQISGVYGPHTVKAIKTFQVDHSLVPAVGIAGPDTIGALGTRIVIDQSSHRLTLYRVGKQPVVFGVAVGQPAYPTPNGTFHIIVKVVDPTWVPPPDAPWAQGALPIPPGPGNPLGTRWMGLNAPSVGIHGTDDPGSIGYSVSHGCIRMQIPDAERLFDMVYVGTTVKIQP